MSKKLKLIHTADWHIGQRFYDYDRKNEHQKFLEWLLTTIKERQTDLLVISGDIFDTSAPSATSQQLFYDFLYKLTLLPKKVRVIIIAGNHDGASRLEAPARLMNILNISVVGSVKKIQGEIDPEQMIIDIKDENEDIIAYIAAVPYLRQGDYPAIKDVENVYTSGVSMLYEMIYDQIQSKEEKDIPVIALGHLHCATASLSDSERGIKGGLEVIDDETLDAGFDYIALGHIHKSQRISGKDHIRYSGSPLPMSFSELNYKHKVIEVEFEGKSKTYTELEIPRTVDMIRIGTPEKPLDKDKAIIELMRIPEVSEFHPQMRSDEFPFLEVNIFLEGPDLLLSNTIKEILQTRCVRLAGSRVYYKRGETSEEEIIDNIEQFQEMSPLEMFRKTYAKRDSAYIPDKIMDLFNEVINEIEQESEGK